MMVVTSQGLVFYVSPTIKDYLGFHQVSHKAPVNLLKVDVVRPFPVESPSQVECRCLPIFTADSLNGAGA